MNASPATSSAATVDVHPVAVDTEIAALMDELHNLAADITYAKDSIKRAEDAGRPACDAQVSRLDEAQQRMDARFPSLTARIEALGALYIAAGRWPRWYLVTTPGTRGHLHTSTACHTGLATTQWSWIVEESGRSAAEIVESWREQVCTVCIPEAPTLPGYRTTAEAAAARDAEKGICSNRTPVEVKDGGRWRPHGSCAACGARIVPVGAVGLHKHRHHRDGIAADRAARIANPTLMHDANGDELRVDREWRTDPKTGRNYQTNGRAIRSVRTAETEYIDQAADAHRTSNAAFGRRCQAVAEELLVALAGKFGTSVDAQRERLAARLTKRTNRRS